MRKIYTFIILLTVACTSSYAQQVTVQATDGDLLRDYTTLTEAFNAINSGIHRGDIDIRINANTTEPGSATLHSGDADPCSYSTVDIYPTVNAVTISGAPAAGFGLIQFNGADNVTINGDNPNTAGTNKNLTITNTAVATQTFSSVIRIATSANVLSADNITITNTNINGNVTGGNASGTTLATSSSNLSFGIYVGGNGGTAPLNLPAAITNETTNPAPAGTIIKGLNVDNNIINQCGRGIVFNGANPSISTGISISNNTIGGSGALTSWPYAAPVSTVYTRGIWVAGTDGVSITGNTLRNIMSYVATPIIGIELAANIGVSNIDVTGNTITGISNNGTGTGGTADGILISSVGGPFNVNNNNITTVHNGSTVNVSGINIATSGGEATIANNKITDLFAHNTGGWGAKGINLGTAANGALIQNNFISNILNVSAASFGNAFNVNGILLNSGNDHKVYHNSIHLSGTISGTTTNSTSCIAITAVTQSGIDIRNNILSNVIAGGSTTDAHVCLFLPFTVTAPTAAAMNLTLNNNGYYTGSTSGKHGIAFAGATAYAAANFYETANFISNQTVPATNWRSFASTLGVVNNDYASFATTAAAPFLSASDLHITAGATQLESGGAALGVTTDIDNGARNGVTPDIGADEFAGTTIDLTAPLIAYTPLTSTCTGGTARTLNVTVTDRSGVPTGGAGLPVLYWRINALPFTAAPGVSLGGGVYQFTFGAGTVLTDVVTYYIVAQDNLGNVISAPNIGAINHTPNPPTVVTAPTVLESYAVQNALPGGTYTVGSGGTYSTLTAAVNAYNNSCLTGPVIFELIDNIYPSETYPITINHNAFSNSTNTLTIRPEAGQAVNMTGDHPQAFIKLNGADWVTLDGLNAGGSSWAIRNTNAGTTSTVIWIASNGADGATNNAVRNLTLRGSAPSTSIACVLSGNGASFGNAATAPNVNNTVTGNTMLFAQNGLYLNGYGSAPYDQNWVVTNNTIGTNAEQIGFRGFSIQRVDGYTVSGNTISYVALSSTSAATGIAIFNHAVNGQIFNNRINNIRQNGTSGAAYGILLQSSSTTSNVKVYNNFVWAVSANGSATVNNNGFGIMVGTGGGYDIYYNSVSMNLPQTSTSSVTAAIRIGSSITAGNSVNIVNNIFANTQTQASPRYSIYSEAPASVFGTINYNNYYAGTSAFLAAMGGNHTTLSSWQAATSDDSRSVSTDPLFINAGTDLHLQATSPLNALGLHSPAITTIDIDGTTRSNPGPDMGADEFIPAPCVANTGGTITAPVVSFCVSGSTTLSASGFATGLNIAYQWEFSTTGAAGPFNPLAGQTIAPSASTGTINTTTWYRLRVICNAGAPGYSNVLQILVNNAAVTSTVPGTRCGTGEVMLEADGTGDLSWYTAPTGGSPVGTGPTFTTPIISTTTTYYVSASAGGTVNSSIPSPPVSTTSFHSNATGWGLRFNVTAPVTINTVDVYLRNTTSGPASIQILITDLNDVVLYSGPVHNFTSATALALQVVPVGIALPIGTYKMVKQTTGINGMARNTTGVSFPYNSPGGEVSIYNSSNGAGAANTTSAYYWFYNWTISTGCESARTAVTATVTPAPSITATATPAAICLGQSTSLSASSSNTGYTYQWTPGPVTGTPVTVSPVSTTVYTLNALDVSGGPNSGCATSTTVTVTVNALPSPVDVNPATPSVCAGNNVSLTATGGAVNGFVQFNSGTISVPIPDNSTTGISHTLAVAGIPAGAVVDSIIVTATIPITFVSDIIANLEAPNGQIINLISGITVNSDDNFTNTRITSNDLFPALSSGTAPFTGTFRADKAAQASLEILPVPAVTTTTWAPLYTVLNGNWRIRCYDDDAAITGTLTNWQIKIHYSASATFAWTPAAGLNTTTGTTVIASPSATTTYVATATNAAGCTRADSATVTVQTGVISAVTSSTICPGQNATLSVALSGTGPWTFTYTANGGSPVTVTNTNTNPHIITVTPTVNTNYQLTSFSNGSCSVTAANLPAIATINVHPAPSVTITPAPASICEGGTVTLTATGGTSYSWTGPNLSSATGNPVTATPPNGSIAYSVTATDANGCTGTIGTLVTVNPALPVSATVTTPATTVCSGASVVFTANAVNPGTGTPYQWQVNGVNQGAPTASNTFTYSPANGDIIRVIITSNALCATGSPYTSAGVTMTVSGSTAASVSLASSGALCSGNSITFTATPTSGGGSPNYEFFVNSGSVQNGPSATYSYIPAPSDNVHVIMTSSLACATGSPATSNIVTVNFFASPTTAPTATCLNLRLGNNTTLSANATAGSGSITSYQWQLAGVPIGGATGVTYTTTTAGTYSVVITNSNGCSTTSANVVITNATGALPGGVYTINPVSPGCNNFTSLNNAVQYLNNNGIAASVTFNLSPGYTETAMVGGISLGTTTLNGTLNSGSTLTFQKSGAGVNPRITAFTPQVNASATDAVIKILGSDYVTFDGIDVAENAGNTTANIMTEFGYGIFYITTTDGAKNVTIKNSTVTLSRLNVNSFGIYSNVSHSATSNTAVPITNVSGNNDNLTVTGNTITDVNSGIVIVSPPTLMGMGIDIGGTAASTGNTITDFGGGNSSLIGVPANNAAGVIAVAQYDANISYNTITSFNGAVVANTLRGIYLIPGASPAYPAGGPYNTDINNNIISLRTSLAAGPMDGIRNETGALATPNLNLSISNNNFIGFNNTGASPTGAVNFILNTGPTLSQNINGNTFTNLTVNSTGNVTFISNAVALPANGIQNVNNNSVVTAFNKTGAGGTIVFYTATTGSNASGTINNNNNNFSNLTFTGATINGWSNTDATVNTKNINGNTFNNITNNTSGNITILNIASVPNVGTALTMDGNTISNISTNGTGNIVPITVPLSVTNKATVTNNTVSNISTTSTALQTAILMQAGGGSPVISNNTVNGFASNGNINGITGPLAGTAVTFDGNIVTGLASNGAGGNVIGITASIAGSTVSNNTVHTSSSTGVSSSVTGILVSNNASVTSNTIHNLTSSGTGNPNIYGMNIGTGTITVNKNRIYNLSITGALLSTSSGTANGILLTTGGAATVTATNNYISDIKAPASASDNTVRGVTVNNTAGTQNYNLYYNTIFLNPSGTGDFGASAIFQSTTGTAVTTVTLRNNIIVNEGTPSGTGRIVAYRRANAIAANYGASSNNNVFYAGTPAANRLIYFDGTAGDQLFADYQTRVAPRDALSLGHRPAFVNTSAAPYDLHLSAAINCSLDGQGDNTGILLADDFDGNARMIVNPFTTDIGADEFAGTGGSPGVWKGVNSNWNDIANWCDAVPTAGTNVTLPAGTPFYPVITAAGPVARNLTIAAAANITVNSGAAINIKGNFINSGTVTNNGTIKLDGTTAQTFPGSGGTIAAMNTLEVNNTAGVTINRAFTISGALLPTTGTINLNNVEVTIGSNATGTARVGIVGTNNAFIYTGTGRFVVERYIPAHNKAWQLLATPASGQTIKQTWQEGNSEAPVYPPTNIAPGYGTIITGTATGQGFDIVTPLGSTLKKWNALSGTAGVWDNMASTLGNIADPKGYMLLVRGERGVYVNQTPSTATTLRTRGRIAAPGGADAPAVINIPAGRAESVGNPYASAIDFTTIGKTNLTNGFYVWDPTISGTYGLGGYQSFAASTGWLPTTPSPIYPAGVPVQVIQSGQAFMVMSSGPAGTVTFAEANKIAGSQTTFRLNTLISSINTGLYAVNGSNLDAADGNTVVFDPEYSDAINADDAIKLVNTGENFGLARESKKLAVDARRPLNDADTIFYVFHNLRTQQYKLKIAPQHINEPDLTAYFVDKYTNSKTEISLTDSSFADFSITSDAGSYAPDRFMIVFKRIPPVSFTTVKAVKQGHEVQVSWKVTNETNIATYEVERSADGIQFRAIGNTTARNTGNSDYALQDTDPINGMNYYRIKSTSVTGSIRYSEIVKVHFEQPATLITLYPNPVKEDRMINISLSNKPAGRYDLVVTGADGKMIMTHRLDHPGRSGIYPVNLSKMFTHGNYLVTVTGPDKKRVTFKIVY